MERGARGDRAGESAARVERKESLAESARPGLSNAELDPPPPPSVL